MWLEPGESAKGYVVTEKTQSERHHNQTSSFLPVETKTQISSVFKVRKGTRLNPLHVDTDIVQSLWQLLQTGANYLNLES